MAETAEIELGGLKVKISLDEKGLDLGAAKAKRTMGDLEKHAIKIGKSVGIAVTAVATAVAGAIGLALKRADDLNKASQKIGVTVQSLSRLEFAARLSDVSLDTLTQSVGKLNRNLSDVAGGGGEQAKQAFQQLGISITDAEGKLRGTDEVLADVAERFASFENGPRKTALAMELFGRSGAQLIPLLNEGKEGLKELGDEAQRLGIVLDQESAAKAERFNDALTRLWAGIQGVATKVMVAALPALENLSDFFESPDFQRAVETFAQGAIVTITAIAQAIVGITNAAGDLFNFLASRSQTLGEEAGGMDNGEIKKQIAEAQAIIDNPNSNSVAIQRSKAWQEQLEKELALRTQIVSTWSDMAKTGPMALTKAADPEDEGEGDGFELGPMGDIDKLQEELDARLELLREGLATETELEATNFADRQAQLADFLEREMITKQEYDLLMQRAEKEHWDAVKEIRMEAMTDLEKFQEMSFKDQAKTIFGELERITAGVKNENDVLFNINKAAAVANAVINTYEGISKSLSAYPMPIAAVMAGIHAAAGFAQVSSILSTSRNSTGGSAKGLSGAASAADGASTQPAAGQNSSTMFVKGLSSSDLFSGANVRQIAESLLEYQRDGGQVVWVE